MKKTAKKKVMVIKLKPEPVPSGNGEIAASLQSLQVTSGWQIILKILNENIEYLERAIMEKCDPQSGAELSEIEVDQLRYKRNLSIEVRDTPKRMVQECLGVVDDDNRDDPYETADDVRERRVVK